MRRGPRRRLGAAILRAGAEGQRRRAGRRAGAATADGDAATSTRSTARSRCSSTRSARCRSLAVAHQLGHVLMGENDERIDLLRAAASSTRATTARYNVFYGEGRDALRRPRAGRRTRRSSTSTTAGSGARARSRATRRSPPGPAAWPGRCSASPRSWSSSTSSTTPTLDGAVRDSFGPRRATCDFYIEHSPPPTACRTGTRARPGLVAAGRLAGRARRPVQRPRAGRSSRPPPSPRRACCGSGGARPRGGRRYTQAGLTVARTLLDEPYLSTDPGTRGCCCTPSTTAPTAGTTSPPGQSVPNGESSMWGDYHLRELALYLGAAGRRAVLHVLRRGRDERRRAGDRGVPRDRPGHRARPGRRPASTWW